MAQAQAKKGDSLTKKLRDYSVKYVKISEDDMSNTRSLVRKYIEDQVMMYCQSNSTLPISRLEYTGSVYERLKTEAADEVDIMVVLEIAKSEVVAKDSGIPGYARLMSAPGSKFREYASPEGYINPERLRNGWFYSLVVKAVNNLPRSDVNMVVRAHGPAVQLDIVEKGTREKLVSADLVPSFQTGPDSYYVAKPYTGKRYVSNPDLLWRESFSLKEKQILEYMDRDGGCRHELLRIVKTIVNRNPTSLGALESYHLKAAFMHYMNQGRQNWVDENALERHFVGFLRALQSYLERANLPHYWLPGVNLLEDINQVVIGNVADRLKKILKQKSKAERNKILA
ncbi:cyclic GMP-AMP synthase-like receptor 3 [Oculina patagonica]